MSRRSQRDPLVDVPPQAQRRRMRLPEEYALAAEKALEARATASGHGRPLAQVHAALSVAAALVQIHDQLSLVAELLAAHPAISHVIATRQIIAEMQAAAEGQPEEDETDAVSIPRAN